MRKGLGISASPSRLRKEAGRTGELGLLLGDLIRRVLALGLLNLEDLDLGGELEDPAFVKVSSA